jgi:hypothetical protein
MPISSDMYKVIQQLNFYLIAKQRHTQLTLHYCHGITLLWLYKMLLGEEKWFYDTIASILSQKVLDKIEQDLECFISYIEWFQHANYYMPSINQLDLEKLSELPLSLSMSCLVDSAVLDKLLAVILQENTYISLSSHNHTIGIVKRSGKIYLFDIGNQYLQPRLMTDLIQLRNEVIFLLYKRSYLPIRQFPLHLFVLADPLNKNHLLNHPAKKIYWDILNNSNDVNAEGLYGLTNLQLACESGNLDAVKILLKRGANPNQRYQQDWTVLHLVAAKGYTPIAKLLIKFGADIYQCDANQREPVDVAKENKQRKMVKLLSRQNIKDRK